MAALSINTIISMHIDWQIKFEHCAYSIRLLDKIQTTAQARKQDVDISIINKAIYYAKTYHGEQKRDSGEPFYSHPLEVAYMLVDFTLRTDLLATAILHDTIEDTELTKPMIAEAFGDLIAGQVEDLTRIKEDGKISSKELVELLRKQKKSDILLIKLLDRVHNVQTISAKSPEKVAKVLKETLNSFICIAMSLELLEIEEELSKKCCNFFLGKQANLEAKNILSLASFANNGYNIRDSNEDDIFLKSFVTNNFFVH